MRQFQLCCKVPSWSSKSGRLLCFSPGPSFCHIKTVFILLSLFEVTAQRSWNIHSEREIHFCSIVSYCHNLLSFLPSLIFLSILKASVVPRDQGISGFGTEESLWHVVGQVWTTTLDGAFVRDPLIALLPLRSGTGLHFLCHKFPIEALSVQLFLSPSTGVLTGWG